MKNYLSKALGKEHLLICLVLLVAGIVLLIASNYIEDDGFALASWCAGVVSAAMFIIYPLAVIWVKSIGMPPFPVDEKRLRG